MKIPIPLTIVVTLLISVGEKFENKIISESREKRIARIITAMLIKNIVNFIGFVNLNTFNFEPPFKIFSLILFLVLKYI